MKFKDKTSSKAFCNKPIKVLHIVGDSKYGGGSLIIIQLVEVARQQDWKVDVLTTDREFQEVLRKRGIGVVDIDVIRRDINIFNDIIGVFRLARFLRHHRYDIIHTHTSKGGMVGRLAAWLAHCPVIVHTVHGFSFHEESSPLALRIYSFLERIAAHWCNCIVTVSEFHRRWALQLKIGNEEKVVAVPNGINKNRILPDKSRAEVLETLGLPNNTLLILTHGRLAEQKGLEYLIQCIPSLQNKLNKPFKIILAGDGPLRSSLEKQVAELGVSADVIFLGFTHEIHNLLNACDMVVLPSLWEGLSISLLEAMAAQKPIITTTIESNIEVTHNGEAAVLIPAKDVGAITDSILKLAADDILAKALSLCARDIFMNNYTEEVMGRKYYKIYADLLAKEVRT